MRTVESPGQSLYLNGSPVLETSVGLWSWSWSSAVSSLVTKAMDPAVHYFPPGSQLPPQLPSFTAHWLVPNCLVTEAHVCKQLVQDCTCQCGGQDSNPWPADRKSISLTTRLPTEYLKPINLQAWKVCKSPLILVTLEKSQKVWCLKSRHFTVTSNPTEAVPCSPPRSTCSCRRPHTLQGATDK